MSKRGTFILEDERYQYIVEHFQIHKLIKYQLGFNSITYYIQQETKITEHTVPKYYFKQLVFCKLQSAMNHILKNISSVSANEKQREFEYIYYLNKYYPEELI